MRRVLRLLASVKFIKEPDKDTYEATELSSTLQTAGYSGGIVHLFTQVSPVLEKLPEHLAKNDFKNPIDPSKGPFQYGMATDESFFKWLVSHPREGSCFNSLMAAFHEQTQLSWVNIYPVTNLVDGQTENVAKAKSPFVVDVGGGIGRDMENFRQVLLPRVVNLMVQDLPSVIAQGKSKYSNIEFMEHDFFQEQPIHGARAYFMHNVLHDWPNERARTILQILKPAFNPGYSKLLLCESVLPERAVRPLAGAMDVVMMGLLCSQERIESAWIELLDSAGFAVCKIWKTERSGQSVIEAEPYSRSKV